MHHKTIKYWSFYTSELIYFALFNMRHPVYPKMILHNQSHVIVKLILLVLISNSIKKSKWQPQLVFISVAQLQPPSSQLWHKVANERIFEPNSVTLMIPLVLFGAVGKGQMFFWVSPLSGSGFSSIPTKKWWLYSWISLRKGGSFWLQIAAYKEFTVAKSNCIALHLF